jgi:hypothetical protein
MDALLCTLLTLLASGGECKPHCDDFGYLYEPICAIDHDLHGACGPYVPQPGDIVMMTDQMIFWQATFIISCAGHPHHSGIVFQKPDGSLALLEAGPHDTLFVEVLDLAPHLRSYEEEGRVWVRRRKVPLTCEQSAALTEFAMRQESKRFALIRLGAQLTPFRARGPIRSYFVGKYHGERNNYFCAELLITACAYSGLLDPKMVRPTGTYPRDFFLDRSCNIYNNRHLCLADCWEQPSRWVSCPGVIVKPKHKGWGEMLREMQESRKRNRPRRCGHQVEE